ncbi:MAG: PEP-CTERM sorting domain-containing protein [Caldimonas sp.]
MFRRWILVTLFCAGSAHAATFDFNLEGTSTTLWNPYAHPECLTGDAPGCREPHVVPWIGSMHVQTDSFADGTYFGAHLLSFGFTSNLFAYPDLPGWSHPPTITLFSGKVASVSLHGDGDNSFFDIRGFDASFQQGEPHADFITATGTLAPVPEPDTGTLLLAGLALVGIVARRRRSSALNGRNAAS